MDSISVSICPTELDFNGDIIDGDRLVSEMQDYLENEFPDCDVTVQIGYRQGDSWATVNGVESTELDYAMQSFDWTNENIFA